MKLPYFHAEFNEGIFYAIPTLCWMRLEEENGDDAGQAIQILFLNITLQWHWE